MIYMVTCSYEMIQTDMTAFGRLSACESMNLLIPLPGSFYLSVYCCLELLDHTSHQSRMDMYIYV
jgi:hypothetical protein